MLNNYKITEFLLIFKLNFLVINNPILLPKIINMLFYENKMHVYTTKRMRYKAPGYGMSWIRVVLLTMLPSNWKSWNEQLSPTTFIHNYKNLIILHITIDFHYKAVNHYYQLVLFLFSLHDCMSLDQNDDWCPFAYRSIILDRV